MRQKLFVSILILLIPSQIVPKKGVVVVPIADLVDKPLQACTPHLIPICGGSLNPTIACPRTHQLLFNEVVDIEKESNNAFYITIPNGFYITPTSSKPQHSFWICKKNVVLLNALKKTDLTKIPPQVSWKNPKTIDNDQVITLAMPYEDPKTNRLFSAGTRFIKAEKESTSNHFAVYILDPATLNFTIISIPTKVVAHKSSTPKEKVKKFVALIKRWAHLTNGWIPYVWGGCSILYASNGSFVENNKEENGIKSSYFDLSDAVYHPKCGLDCTGLILRAAQIAGIPYFYKNTTTLATYLRDVPNLESLQEGDLIWIFGHVMIVSSIAKNLLIEARAYSHGYGKVQEIPLSSVFKDMNTYKDLLEARSKQTPLIRLKSDGSDAETFPIFKILSLSSIWK